MIAGQARGVHNDAVSARSFAALRELSARQIINSMTTKVWLWFGGLVYGVTIVIVVAVLFDARRRMVDVYGTTDEQSNWDDYRAEMDRRHQQRESLREDISVHSGQPVEAAPPKKRSDRPPTLELLENHFLACLAVTIVGVTMLFALIWGMLMGAMLRPGRTPDYSPAGDDSSSPAN